MYGERMKREKKALIFGAGGQAGYYLTELLKGKGYAVANMLSTECNVTSTREVLNAIVFYNPDEVYNLASKPIEYQNPVEVMHVNMLGTQIILESLFKFNAKAKFFLAGSASIFKSFTGPLCETSPKEPSTVYGVSKLAAQQLVKVYRDKGYFACTGIFFNMESKRRSNRYFTRKVTSGLAKIRKAIIENRSAEYIRMYYKLQLGNLTGQRDWGLTSEYMEAVHRMMKADKPDDYVIGTGVTKSCYSFVSMAAELTGLTSDEFKQYVSYDDTSTGIIDTMWSNPAKIHGKLGWYATSIFQDVVKHLVEAAAKELELEYGQSITA